MSAVETRMCKGLTHIYPFTRRTHPASFLARHAAHFFPQPLARQCLLDTLLFTRLKVERVFLYVFDDVFLLNFALETAKSAFEGFPFIQDNFCQSEHLLSEGIRYSPQLWLSSISRQGKFVLNSRNLTSTTSMRGVDCRNMQQK
jgi:hypothetical protein